jgi:hypothetical protein
MVNSAGENVFTCHNPSCKRTFTAPLKTLNLQEEAIKPYLACPYCLTNTSDRIGETVENNARPKETQMQEKVLKIVNNFLADSAAASKTEKAPKCQFHLGYLSERTQKEKITEECLVCKDMVACMLKKINE